MSRRLRTVNGFSWTRVTVRDAGDLAGLVNVNDLLTSERKIVAAMGQTIREVNAKLYGLLRHDFALVFNRVKLFGSVSIPLIGSDDFSRTLIAVVSTFVYADFGQ